MTSDEPAGSRPASARPRAGEASARTRLNAWLAALAVCLEGRSVLARIGMILGASALLWGLVVAVVLATIG